MYYFAFIYLFVLVFFDKQIKDKYKIWLALIPLLLIIVLRYGVGADYFSYERIYDSLASNTVLDSLIILPRINILYKLANIVAIQLGMSYHVFASLFTLGLTYATLKFIENNSPNIFLSVLLYFSMLFFYWNLSALRQGFVLLVLMSIYFNGKKDYSVWVKAVSTVLLFFMHPTAIIVPVIYMFSLIPFKRLHFLILLILAPLSRIIFSPAVLNMFSTLPYVGIFTSYLRYDPISYLSLPSFLRLTFFLAILWHFDDLTKKYPHQDKMFKFSLLSLVGYFYLPVSMVIGTRVTIFGYYLVVVIFPMILSLYKSKKLYPVVLAGIMSFSVVSFYNEYSKLNDRTGYEYSMHRLNFETVLKKDRLPFNNAYSMHLHINEVNNDYFKNTELSKKINKKYYENEVAYRDDLEYLSVYFPGNNKFGIINSKGDILIKPIFNSSFAIYGSVREIDIGIAPFISKAYMPIDDSNREILSYEVAQPIILDHLDRERKTLVSEMFMEEVEVDILNDYDFLEVYNIGPVVIVEKYHYADKPEYAYLKLKTNYANYYIILKNDKVLVDKIYNSVSTISAKDILVGRTRSTVEYINSDGKIIWYETPR